MTITKDVKVRYVAKDSDGGFLFGNVGSAYGATERYFTRDGKPFIVIAGEFHFSRYDRALWETEVAKMKTQGINCISAYVFWNHHETSFGVFDFSGNRDVKKFISICKKYGLNVVLRIGPWCHGEVKRGGFPDYLAYVPGKRKNTPVYLYFVKRFWKALYNEVKEFCDGKTILGIQLENEYGGNISHIVKLRRIAEKTGFKTPYFTMTAWPTNTPDDRFVPMFGGYPEAPWTQNKKPLRPCGRFAITEGRSEIEIGEDLLGTTRCKASFSKYPYATCETGTGNQVTQHRRPVISENDGFGVAFAKFASGAVWMGYYMYHGGRNPSEKPMQESRRTLYPNDYPIVDYDFQAPLSKDGDVRGHADRLRLLHLFSEFYGQEFARTQAFFDKNKNMPYFSYRADENGGYLFLSNYERGAVLKDETVDVKIDADTYRVEIKGIGVSAGDMFFMPVKREYGGILFDYITAQPVLEVSENGVEHVYFASKGDVVRICVGGKEKEVCREEEEIESSCGKTVLHFLPPEKAKKLYYVAGKVVFSDFPLYEKDGRVYGEKKTDAFEGEVSLKEISPIELPYDSYMFSSGKRAFYLLKADNNLISDDKDLEITLDFEGLNLQIFKDGKIVDDYFNTDGKCVFRLRRLADDGVNPVRLVIRTCAARERGYVNVYNEYGIKPGKTGLKLGRLRTIETMEVKI